MVVASKQVNEAEEAKKTKEVKEAKNAKRADESREAKALAKFRISVGCEKVTRHENSMSLAHGCREHKNLCSVKYACRNLYSTHATNNNIQF